MTPKQLKSASKFLSLILRHRPEVVNVTLDDSGWVGVDVLLTAIQTEKPWYTREVLDEVVATNNKKRFEFSEDDSRIRARQGHSVDVDLGYTPKEPPTFLFHGTAEKHMVNILKGGLRKMKRHHVHLSPDEATATSVGARHGKVVVLRVRAADLARTGAKFYVTANHVWLTDRVPLAYFERV